MCAILVLITVSLLFFANGIVSESVYNNNSNYDVNVEDIWCENFCQSNLCNCTNANKKLVTFKSAKLETPKVVCKEDSFINLSWELRDNFHYVLELITEDNRIFTDVTKNSHYTIHPLNENTYYQIRLWGALINETFLIRSNFLEVKTLNSTENPLPVSKLSLKQLTLNNNYEYEAIIAWTAASDLACFYDLVWFEDNSRDHYTQIDISWQYLSEYKITGLIFENNYTVSIAARRSNRFQESSKTWLHFVTPSCLETYSSLVKCRPEAPQNLTVKENFLFANITFYDVIVKWSKPKFIPDYYIVHFLSLIPKDNKTQLYLNISGKETEVIFPKIERITYYQVSLTAWSLAGPSKIAFANRHLKEIPEINHQIFKWSITHTFLSAIIIICVILIIALINLIKREYKKQKLVERCQYFKDLEVVVVDVDNQQYVDEWEIEPNRLSLQNVIGEGAFGIVKKAYLKFGDDKIEVAAKMLKPFPSSNEIREFYQEIDIMKSVGGHPNLVSLIGCITRGRPDGPLLVVEYCSQGDLQSYLRNISNNSTMYCFLNRIYFNNNDFIESKDLLSFAYQITLGMEYLTDMKVIHRDLAARNVLICENKSIKISDFGLSRDIYMDSYYVTSGGRLPIKWMALESINYNMFTTKSDVWSFGVLLWEIITLGKTPYAGMLSADILAHLKAGHRLEQPNYCNNLLYSLMCSCWHISPSDRPTFMELKKSLGKLLETAADYLYLDSFQKDDTFYYKENDPEAKKF